VILNANLLPKSILNLTRSRDYAFDFDVHIDLRTPTEVVRDFRQRILDYIKKNPKVL
jgi:hypothetical protein